ncbi:MAG TPA: hypothetical protein VF384_03040, partial [Planctomycetota bacterium]
GTGLFADLTPGTGGSRPNGFVTAGNRVFFRAFVNNLEVGLFVTDGTVAGTHAVLDLPGSLSADILDMVAVGNNLYFVADDRVRGRELWISDGTAAGTRLVIDLDQGPGDGVLAGTLAVLGTTGLVGFAGHDGGDGLQLWASDGTAAGTQQLGRIGAVAGAGAATIHSLRLAGTKLFFVADDGVLGEELWVFDFGAPNAALAQNYGSSNCPGTANRTPHIAAFGLPVIGNGGFAVDVDSAMPNSIAVLFVSFAPSAFVLDGCRVLLGLPVTSLSSAFTDPTGFARTPFPIPANPALQGFQVFGQYLVLDPAGPLFGDFTLSDGLRMRLGN